MSTVLEVTIRNRCINAQKYPSLVYKENYVWSTRNITQDINYKDGITHYFMDPLTFSLKCPINQVCLLCYYRCNDRAVFERMNTYKEPLRIAIKRVSLILL